MIWDALSCSPPRRLRRRGKDERKVGDTPYDPGKGCAPAPLHFSMPSHRIRYDLFTENFPYDDITERRQDFIKRLTQFPNLLY